MNKHTPGPWQLISDVIPTAYRIKSVDTIIASCYHFPVLGWDNSRIPESDPDGPGMEESKANAKLIAAAPLMAQELKESAEWLLTVVRDCRLSPELINSLTEQAKSMLKVYEKATS